MCGLFVQDDIDNEVSIANYFVSRVIQLSKIQDEQQQRCLPHQVMIEHPSVTDVSHLTRTSLLSKYYKIIDVLQNQLDYIDPQVYSNLQQCCLLDDDDTDDEESANISHNNKEYQTIDDKRDHTHSRTDLDDDRNVARIPLNSSTRKSQNNEKTSQVNGDIGVDDNLVVTNTDTEDIYKERARKKQRSTYKQLDYNSYGNVTAVVDDDSDNHVVAKRKSCTVSTLLQVPTATATVTKQPKQKQKGGTRNSKAQSMQKHVERLEENLLIKEFRANELLKRKEERLKKKEMLLDEQREKIRIREEKRKAKQDIRKKISWNEQFQRLLKFYKENGHCNPVARKTPLGHWLQTQRAAYRHKSPLLTPERIHMFNSIGLEWEPRPTVPFENRLQDCIQTEQNSDDDQYVIDWMKNTVEQYASRILPRSTPSITKKSTSTFAERLAELAWVKEKGCSINDKQSILKVFPNNNTLIAWAKCVRRNYKLYIDGKDSTLTEDRVVLLNELGFDFFPRKHYAPPGSKKKAKSNTATESDSIQQPIDTNNDNENCNTIMPPTNRLWTENAGTSNSTGSINTCGGDEDADVYF